jgi:hypothetical protein
MTTSLQPLRRTLIVLAASAALALSGCGGDEPDAGASASPEHSDHADQSDSPSPSKSDGPVEAAATVDVTIEGDEVTPVAQAVQIGVGETVLLNVTSDRSGELHVHSSPEQELEFEAGTTELEVTLDQPGSVDIEEHESDMLVVRVLVK